jgi:cytochrome c-type biogenesis protein CcmI
MFIIIAIVLSVVAVVYVALPLFRQSADGIITRVESDRTGDLLYQKELALATIKDLDFDMQTGKLAEADHAELVTAQQRIISQTEQQLTGTTQKKADSGRSKYCSACGHPHGAEARFCSQCGAALTQAN